MECATFARLALRVTRRMKLRKAARLTAAVATLATTMGFAIPTRTLAATIVRAYRRLPASRVGVAASTIQAAGHIPLAPYLTVASSFPANCKEILACKFL